MLRVNYLILSITILYFGRHAQVSGSITLLNSTNAFCEQDVAQFNCSVAAGPNYAVSQAGLSVNGSACIVPSSVNSMYPRIRFTSTALDSTSPPAEYTISPYLLEDSVTQYSCCANDNLQAYYYTDNLTLLLAVPPAANITLPIVYVSACNGTITLTWPAVTSVRAVTDYEVLQNGVLEATLPPSAGTLTYPVISMTSLLKFTGRYTVRAINCAGSSFSNEVVFSPPNFPSPFTFSLYFLCSNSSQANLNISLPSITSDRPITHYILYINNQLEDTRTANGNNYMYNATLLLNQYSSQSQFNFTVTAYSCAGSASSSDTSIQTNICEVSAGLSTGAIAGIAVGGVCFIFILWY